MITFESVAPETAVAAQIVRDYMGDDASRWHRRPATEEEVDQVHQLSELGLLMRDVVLQLADWVRLHQDEIDGNRRRFDRDRGPEGWSWPRRSDSVSSAGGDSLGADDTRRG